MLCVAVRWRHGGREGLFTRRCCLGLERENPFRTAGKTETSLLVSTLEGRRDLEARSVVASSRVPRSGRGKPVSLPAAGHLGVGEGDLPQAAVRPLVRIPTDRHVATGTCEFGRGRYRPCRRDCKNYFALTARRRTPARMPSTPLASGRRRRAALGRAGTVAPARPRTARRR